jgi:hypothetical protein
MIAQHLRRHLAALAVWTALWGLFFGAFLVGREQLAAGDLSGQFHAYALFQAQEMRAGRVPLWSPGSYGGLPFAADPQAAAFYPPRWLTILAAPSADLPFALLQFEILAHVWLAGALTYGLLYALTRRRAAGLVAAVSLGLGGYLTGYPLLQLAILETMAWLPGALLAIQMAFESRRPAPWLVCAGLALALAGLAGHPQTWMHVAYLSIAWFLARAVEARWPWRRVLAAGALLGGVALGVAAVGWLPALRYTLHTARSGVDYAFVSSGLPLADWVQALVPTTMSLWAPQYGGIAVVALALIGWRLRGAPGPRRAAIVFWAGAALVSAWLALGDTGALYRVAHRLLPGMALFRQQERWLGLWAMSLSVLGGLGLAAWLDATAQERRRALAWAARLLALGLAMALCLLALWRGPGEGWESTWLRHTLIALAALGLLALERHRRLACGALVLLLAVDLYVVSLATVVRQPSNAALRLAPEWLSELDTEELERWDLTFFVYANWGEAYGLETVSGISPLRPVLLDELRRLPRERYWQLLNVRYVVSTDYMAERPGLALLHHVPHGAVANQEAEAWVYRLEETLPRAYMVYEAEPVADAAQALERLRDPAWEPRSLVLLLASEAPAAASLPVPERPATVIARRLSPRSLAFAVDTASPGYLVVGEWRLPGWRATLDGEPAPLLTANYAFQALHVPAGEHLIELTYAGADVLWSGVGSLAALVGALAAALAWRPPVAAASRKPWAWPQRLRLPGVRLGAAAERALVGGLILAGLGLRLYALGRPELGPDEACAYLAAMGPGQAGGLLVRSWYPLLLRGWSALFGAGELALRLPAALAGAALIPALWRLGRRWVGAWGGLGTAALAAISPGLLRVSQSADGGLGLALLLVVLATCWLCEATERGAWPWGALYAGVMALALGVWPPSGWVLLAHGAYLLAHSSRQRRWGALAIWAPVGAAGIWRTVAASGVAWPLVREKLDAVSASAAFQHLVESLALWIGGAGWGTWAVALMGVMGLLLLVWLARHAWRRRRPVAALLAGWLAATLGGLFLAGLGSEAYGPEATLLAAPAWWAAALLGARLLWRRGAVAGRVVALASLAALAAVGAVGAQRYLAGRAAAVGPGYAALAQTLQAEAQPGDPFLIAEDDPRWRYYLRDTEPQPTALSEADLADEAALERLFAEHEAVWAALPVGARSEREALLGEWLAGRTLAMREVQGAGHVLAAYAPVEQASGVLYLSDATFGDGAVSLVAAHLLVNGRAVSLAGGALALHPGDRVDVDLVWRAAGPTERNLTVFVHLMDGEGRLAAQHDGPPAEGRRPTTAWAPGETILDRHTLAAPESGAWEGALLVGLYDSETIARQLVPDGRDAIRLCEVRLGE